MEVFYHHIYELVKGLRNMALCTVTSENMPKVEDRLKKENIAYVIHKIGANKINIYFGKPECIAVIQSFNEPNLCKLSPQEDFVLGVMLGYDRLQQCGRYLKRMSMFPKAS